MIDRITALSHAILLSEGWRRTAYALLGGGVGALALAPLGLLPALAFSLPVAVWLIDASQSEGGRFAPAGLYAAARDGFWFGYGYFLAGLWWIGAAFLVETDEFLWAMPLGVLGLPLLLAPFIALGFVLARLLWSAGSARLFALAFGIAAGEALRHVVLTGFPWNTYGQAFGATLVFAQGASVIGTDGLSILALLIFAAPATLADPVAAGSPWRATRLAGLALFAVAAFGIGRLLLEGGFAPGFRQAEMVPDVRIRLVQPNTSQRDKIMQRDSLAVVSRLMGLSDRTTGPQSSGLADISHVIWPESPFPSVLTRDQKAMAEIARLLPARTTLITGAVRVEGATQREARYYNTMHVFGPRASLLASYDKEHLVPFGEYLPLEGLLSSIGLRRFVHAPGTFAVGKPRGVIDVPGLPPVLPLICYEAIFPHEIDVATRRPGLLLNITNDAWFGETFGPHQHFAQARLRAIEFGLPMIRVANTGISALIDPHGRILSSLRVGVESISDVFLPKGLPYTVYSYYGREQQIGGLGIVALLAMGVAFFQSRRKSGGKPERSPLKHEAR